MLIDLQYCSCVNDIINVANIFGLSLPLNLLITILIIECSILCISTPCNCNIGKCEFTIFMKSVLYHTAYVLEFISIGRVHWFVSSTVFHVDTLYLLV